MWYDDEDYGLPPATLAQGPGFGPPFGRPSRPPVAPPGRMTEGPPAGPPPATVPRRQVARGIGVRAVDPGTIRGCLFRFTYIWLENGRSFWFFPVLVGRRSVAGWRWMGRRWVYFGIDLDRIDSFTCF